MNIITKAYVKFLSFIFEDTFKDSQFSTKIKNQIVSSYCYKCEGTCNKICECRCHYRSCKKCDENDCPIKRCKCTCHISSDQLQVNKLNSDKNVISNNIARRDIRKLSLFQKTPEIKQAETQSNQKAGKFKKLFANFKEMLEKDKKEAAEESRKKLILRFQKSHSSDKVAGDPTTKGQLVSQKTSVVSKNLVIVPETSMENKLTNENPNLQARNFNKLNDINNSKNPAIINMIGVAGVKERPNIWKNTLSKLKTNDPNNNGRPNSTDLTQKFTDVAKIKRKIQDIKLKGLDLQKTKEILNNMNKNKDPVTSVSPKENLNLTNVSNNNSLDVSKSPIILSFNSYLKDSSPTIGNLVPPIEPNNSTNNILMEPNKPHLKNKFDLNNTVLFYKKSKIVKDFEDFNIISQNEKKVVDKNLQIEAKNILGSSDAWQTYNSFLFGDNIHEIQIEPPEEKQIKLPDLEKKETKKMISTSNTLDKKDSKKLISMSSTLKNKKTNN